MLNSFKYFFKKYKLFIFIALAINIPLILISTIRTNNGVIAKGDTVEFNSVVDIETDYEELGSFSTIYVMSIEGSTPLMNIIAKYDSEMEIYDISESDNILSISESYFAGKIMYASSITQAIIASYNLAKLNDNNIKLDYKFDGYYITYHGINSKLSIGDYIYAIKRTIKNDDGTLNTIIYNKDEEGYLDFISKPLVDDVWYIEESNKLNDDYTLNKTSKYKEIILEEGDSFNYYPIYNINLDNTKPSIKFNTNTIGGPSGGLLQSLSIYNKLISYDLTRGLKISGTGTINCKTLKIGSIGGIKEKIPTAIDDGIDIFFCPKANYEEAYNKYISIKNHEKMKLVMVETLEDAIKYLMGVEL